MIKETILSALLFSAVPVFAQPANGAAWHLSGQLDDGSVKAYSFTRSNGKRENALVFKKGTQPDTLLLGGYGSMLPLFRDSCQLEAVQLDGKGLDEIRISFNRDESSKLYVVKSTFSTFYNLDTRKNIFWATTAYYSIVKSPPLTYENGEVMDSMPQAVDTCIYNCRLEIHSDGTLTIDNVKQKGSCPDNGLWKRTEGVYAYKDGWMLLVKKPD